MMVAANTLIFKEVSVAKAIAIIMMVVGHAFVGTDIEHFAHVFHMPLFFFTAGYCFKDAYLEDAGTFLKKKVVGLWWPYVKWGFVFLLCHNLFFYFGFHNTSWGGFLNQPEEKYAISAIIENFWRLVHFQYQEQLLGGYWFLQDLFWGSLIFFLCKKYVKKDWVILLLLLLVTILFARKKIFDPFFDISSDDVYAAWYVAVGYYFHKKIGGCISGFCGSKPTLALLCAMLGIVGMIISVRYGIYGFKYCPWNQVLLRAVASVLGIVTVWLLSLLFVRLCDGTRVYRCFLNIGSHTLEILTWHFLCFKVVSLLIILLFGLDMCRLAEFPTIAEFANLGWGWLYVFVAIILILSGCHIRDRFLSRRSEQ